MKKLLLTGLFSSALCGAGFAHANLVDVQFVGPGTSVPYHGVYAGYYQAKINDILDFVMCDDVTRIIYPGNTWKAQELTYGDMQSGSNGKFANLVKYSQASWLFEQTDEATPFLRSQMQAAIWTIMSPSAGVTLDPLAQSYFAEATNGTHNAQNWSSIMTVLAPAPSQSGQEFLRHASIPEPGSLVLFGSGLALLAGFTGFSRKAKVRIS